MPGNKEIKSPKRREKTPAKKNFGKKLTAEEKQRKKENDEKRKAIIKEKAANLLDGVYSDAETFNEIRDEVASMSKGDYATFLNHSFFLLDQLDDKLLIITEMLHNHEKNNEAPQLIQGDEVLSFVTKDIRGFYESKKIAMRSLRMVVRSTKKRNTKIGAVLELDPRLKSYLQNFKNEFANGDEVTKNRNLSYSMLKNGLAHRTTIVNILNVVGTYMRGKTLNEKKDKGELPEMKYFALQHKFMEKDELAKIHDIVARFNFIPTKLMQEHKLADARGEIVLEKEKIKVIDNSKINSIIGEFTTPFVGNLSIEDKNNLIDDNTKSKNLKHDTRMIYYDIIMTSKKISEQAGRQLNKLMQNELNI